VVVLDVTDESVIIADPFSGKRTLSHREFADKWRLLGITLKRSNPGRDANGQSSQSQRDCVIQPRVARNELPWVTFAIVFNPNGVVPDCARGVVFMFGQGRNPFRVVLVRHAIPG